MLHFTVSSSGCQLKRTVGATVWFVPGSRSSAWLERAPGTGEIGGSDPPASSTSTPQLYCHEAPSLASRARDSALLRRKSRLISGTRLQLASVPQPAEGTVSKTGKCWFKSSRRQNKRFRMSRTNKKHRTQTVMALDAYYMPMVMLTRRKALKALATGRAHALDLRTWTKLGLMDVASRPFHAVVFPRAKAVAEAKLGIGRGGAAILKRDGYRCQFVGCDRRATTVDHVIPRCQGGDSRWTNLVAACKCCNQRKGGRRPEEAGMALKAPIRSPRAILMDQLHQLVALM